MSTEAKAPYVNSVDRAFSAPIKGVFDEAFMVNAAKGMECTVDEVVCTMFFAFAFNEF